MNNLVELKKEELETIDGGILFALIGYAVNTSLVAGSVAAAALTVKEGFDAGYEAVQEYI